MHKTLSIHFYCHFKSLDTICILYLYFGDNKLVQKNLFDSNFVICFYLKEFAGEDNSDLYLEERENTIRQAQDEKRKVQMSVPGILGPHEMPEEMQDW